MSCIYGVADTNRLGESQFLEEQAFLAPYAIEVRAFNCLTEDELIAQMRECDFCGVVSSPFTARVIESLPNCKGIFRYGIGVDNIDIPAATRRGLPVCYEPQYCVEDVAGQAFAMLLALSRKIALLDRAIRAGQWSFKAGYPSHRLQGQTLGLVGFGNIARRLAELVKAFEMEVVTCDPFITGEFAAKHGVRTCSLEELLTHADYVSVHCPLTADTRHLLSTKEFRQMKPSAFLINTSRGPIVDTEALVEALEAGELCGAGLDVHETEPLPTDHPLCQMQQVILTPHAGFYTEEAFMRLRMSIAEQVAAVSQKEKPRFIINPEVFNA